MLVIREVQHLQQNRHARPGGGVLQEIQYGVLELLNRRHAFRQEDREFLQEVSVFIGLALENAALHEELRYKTRLEEEVARSRERLLQMDRLVLVNEVLSTVLKVPIICADAVATIPFGLVNVIIPVS